MYAARNECSVKYGAVELAIIRPVTRHWQQIVTNGSRRDGLQSCGLSPTLLENCTGHDFVGLETRARMWQEVTEVSHNTRVVKSTD
jgi:hypothetical protein